jgi:hypothetical protein
MRRLGSLAVRAKQFLTGAPRSNAYRRQEERSTLTRETLMQLRPVSGGADNSSVRQIVPGNHIRAELLSVLPTACRVTYHTVRQSSREERLSASRRPVTRSAALAVLSRHHSQLSLTQAPMSEGRRREFVV